MLTKFGLPFDEATPSVHFPKAFKHPRNNSGPASHPLYYYINRLVCVRARARVCVCVCVCVYKRL